uniref:RING-type domain-containing protein n=1 Tax=Hemiselmis andersenii TaxID=464988 RepID=A0A6U4S141_HEMAN|mmetsp:Transcript_11058/g.26762  ORF Transcript_11058/g.26762 Transcript_11058/m.26762 type:complete len:220 (+) Transcript_11058:348-1007(+)
MKPPARKAQKAGAAESAIDLAVSSAKAAPAATGRAARTATRGPARAAQDSAPEQPTANRARGASVNSARRKRRPSALSSTEDDIDASAADSPATCTNANHNKYCHFCQHVKVKRASSMISCDNRGCNRRFCDYCLNTHVQDPARADGNWNCPICRKTCCCTMRECTKNHRHCKAYRYRRKRAAQTDPDVPSVSAFPAVGGAGMYMMLGGVPGHGVMRRR